MFNCIYRVLESSITQHTGVQRLNVPGVIAEQGTAPGVLEEGNERFRELLKCEREEGR